MKQLILFIFLLAAVPMMAQEEQSTTDVQPAAAAMKFGYLSYDSVMVALPAYGEMQTQLSQMNEQYEAEMQRVENDFNKKYEEFLDGQASYPKTILQKRQSELQEMLDKNIAFKKESRRMLDNMKLTLRKTLEATITAAVETLSMERGYCFVINSDKEAVTFVNPMMGEDITEAVKQLLNEK
jgi:outer membrane protein